MRLELPVTFVTEALLNVGLGVTKVSPSCYVKPLE